MKIYSLNLLVSVCSFLIFGSAYACPGNPIPVHLLGRNAYNNEVGFREFLAVVEEAPSPDSELLEVDGTWESWFIVDKNRNYFHLSALDGLIKGIFVDDQCLTTEKGVRVGNSLSRVRAVYPDSRFKQEDGLLKNDFFELLTTDGKVEFWFAASKKALNLIRDGIKVDLNDEVVKESTVTAIIIQK